MKVEKGAIPYTHTHTSFHLFTILDGRGLFQSVRAVMSRPVYFGLPWEYAIVVNDETRVKYRGRRAAFAGCLP